jgi:hypothetical protein
MKPEDYQWGAVLLARAIIGSPDPTPLVREFHPPLRVSSPPPWTPEQQTQLAGLFPWSGVAHSVESGFFGTAAGFDLGHSGSWCIKVYLNARGMSHLETVLERFKCLRRFRICPVPVEGILFATARPAPGGVSIGPMGGSTGTVGAWLRSDTQGRVGISNNHVLCDFNRFGVGHKVIQPGPADNGTMNDVIGEIKGFEPLVEADPFNRVPNTVDLAWVTPYRSSDIDATIAAPLAQSPQGEEDFVQRLFSAPISVVMRGWISQRVTGCVDAIQSSVFITHNGKSYYFEDQLAATLTDVRQGDSGSVILEDGTWKIGGLLFALAPVRQGQVVGFANPWQNVKKVSGLSFAYP